MVRRARPRAQTGFTLVELVAVIIILGMLSAVAVPRFIDLSRNARIVSLQTMAAALQTTAINVRTACLLNPVCDYSNSGQNVTIGGRSAFLNYGWLDAGDDLGVDQIDAWVTYSGFTASLSGNNRTIFSLDSAPSPASCAVSYWDAYFRGYGQVSGIAITLDTSGC